MNDFLIANEHSDDSGHTYPHDLPSPFTEAKLILPSLTTVPTAKNYGWQTGHLSELHPNHSTDPHCEQACKHAIAYVKT